MKCKEHPTTPFNFAPFVHSGFGQMRGCASFTCTILLLRCYVGDSLKLREPSSRNETITGARLENHDWNGSDRQPPAPRFEVWLQETH